MSGLLVCFYILAFTTFISVSNASQRKNSAIIFPSSNSVPLRTEFAGFSKAVKSIHYAAARVLDLSESDDQKNWVVSPVSLAAVLGQLMLGARGEFHRILGEILSPAKDGTSSKVFPGLDVHKELGMLLHLLQDDVFIDYQLDLNSALFMDPDIRLKICYKHALQDIYNVQVFKTNFSGNPTESMKQVNSWVKQATSGRIEDIIDQPPSQTTASIYVNTVYFKAPWKIPFDPLFTRPGFFRVNQTQKVPVDFMAGDIEIKLLEDDECHCKLIGIPYESTNLYLYIFLPDEDVYQLHNLHKSLTLDKISNMIEVAEPVNVTLTLPKVSVTSAISLRKPMVRAIKQRKRHYNSIRGAREVSSEDMGRYFSNGYVEPLPLKIDSVDNYKLTFNMGSASDDYRFKIDDVFHKVALDMNEGGTEAVAVTSTLIDYFGKQIIKIDRPYLFLIRHEFTGAHLFWGVIYNPTNGAV